jgi:hypothetical protein
MARPVERWRQENGIGRLDLELTLLEAYAHRIARVGPAFPQQKQVGLVLD